MLSRGSLGNEFNVLVGRFVSKSELFTMWFQRTKGGGERDTPRLLIASNRWTRRVYEAWRNLDEGTEGSWEHRRLGLMAAIGKVIAEMRAVSGVAFVAVIEAPNEPWTRS